MRNLRARPEVEVRVGRDRPVQAARARVVEEATDEDAQGRRLLLEKYQAPGARDLEGWGRSALLVAVDLAQDDAAAGTSSDITT